MLLAWIFNLYLFRQQICFPHYPRRNSTCPCHRVLASARRGQPKLPCSSRQQRAALRAALVVPQERPGGPQGGQQSNHTGPGKVNPSDISKTQVKSYKLLLWARMGKEQRTSANVWGVLWQALCRLRYALAQLEAKAPWPNSTLAFTYSDIEWARHIIQPNLIIELLLALIARTRRCSNCHGRMPNQHDSFVA